jgi:adhesin/invasin
MSTVTAAPTSVPADGATPATVSVTITDASGNPLPGRTVSLQAAAGASSISAPSGPTNSRGATTFTVTDATPEAVTYGATDVTDAFTLLHTATVTFTGPATAAESTTSASPASVPANSLSITTITATLRDINGRPVAGKTVSMGANCGACHIAPATPGSDTSNPQGVVTFTSTDSTPELVSYTPTDMTDGVTLPSASVTFTGSPSGSLSSVTATPAGVPADGATASTVIVTIVDGIGQPIPGQVIALSQNQGAHSTIAAATQGSATTDADGRAMFHVTDGTAETVTYSAADRSVSPAQQVFATAHVSFASLPAVTAVSPNNGVRAGGTKVTITGTNLSGVTAVMFGSTPASSFTVNKKGVLTAVAPAGAGVVDIVVATAGGRTAVVPADQFTYL